MKTAFYLGIGLLLSACTSMQPSRDEVQRERLMQKIIEQSNARLLMEVCSDDSMPRFRIRPKLPPAELEFLNEAQMDKRIRRHIAELENHVDHLEDVILKTRKRVRLCR